MATPRRESCLICSPFGFGTQVLQNAFDKRRVRWKHVEDLPANRSFIQAIVTALKDSDFACGVVTKDLLSISVLFELGTPPAMNLPLFIFLEHGAESSSFFKRLTRVQV